MSIGLHNEAINGVLILKRFSCDKLSTVTCRARNFRLLQNADFGTRTTHSYMLCGWHTRSDIPLISGNPSGDAGENIDVLIQIARGHSPVAKILTRDVLAHSGEGWLIKIHSVADFEIIRGQHIRVWPATGVTQNDIEICLCGKVWATVCHQRGLLPLHASAITTKAGIAAFAGHSGVGKSTTAALLGISGYELVADDILPISFNQSRVPGAWPYLRRLKLNRDSIVQLALTSAELVGGNLDKGKYFVCPKNIADDKWSRIDRIYLLENDSDDSPALIDQITNVEAARALIDHTYYLDFVLDSGHVRRHLALCTQLASMIPVYRLRFSRSSSIETLRSLICSHLEDSVT